MIGIRNENLMFSFPSLAIAKPYIYVLIIVSYTLGIWHMASKYTSASYLKEKVELIQKAADIKQLRQDLSDSIGARIDLAVGNIHITQKTINQEVIHEITKEPVYNDCRTTPDGVRLIEQSIDNQGQPPLK